MMLTVDVPSRIAKAKMVVLHIILIVGTLKKGTPSFGKRPHVSLGFRGKFGLCCLDF